MSIKKIIKNKSNRGQRMAESSNAIQENKRLSHMLNREPIRPIEGCKLITITTENHITGIKHEIVLSHDPGNGTNRFNACLDGDRWRNGLSRWRFVNWLFDQIQSVRSDWD